VVIDIIKTINKITLDILENDVKPILQVWLRNPTHKEYDYRNESEILEQPLNDVVNDTSRKPPYIQDENGFV
jgi:hypothetical protein